jgi:hypothetical protein
VKGPSYKQSATHPSKIAKDGARSVGTVQTGINSKMGHPPREAKGVAVPSILG